MLFNGLDVRHGYDTLGPLDYNCFASVSAIRYDARLCFTDQSQFVHTPDYEHKPTPEETEIERLCDEERYMEMSKDMTEHEIEQGN